MGDVHQNLLLHLKLNLAGLPDCRINWGYVSGSNTAIYTRGRGSAHNNQEENLERCFFAVRGHVAYSEATVIVRLGPKNRLNCMQWGGLWKDSDATMKRPPLRLHCNWVTLTQHKRKVFYRKKVKRSLLSQKSPREKRAPNSRCRKTRQQTTPMKRKVYLVLIISFYNFALMMPPAFICLPQKATYESVLHWSLF